MVDDNTKEILRDIRDNTNSIQVDPPVGGATEAKQDAIITAIEAIPGGGGTQYTEGDTDASATGTVAMWADTGDTLRTVSAAKPLPVNIVAGAGSGGTASADDADFTAGTTSGTPAMGVYESTPSSVTDGDLGTLGITSGRRLKTSATIDTALPAGTNAIGKLAANSGVDIGDVDVTSITGVTMNNGAIQVTGDEAHDTPDAGGPIKTGGRAQEPTTAPDEVADDDRVDTLHDRVGRVAVYQGYPRWYATINVASSGDNTIKAAAGAGKKIVVTSVSIISDGTVDIRWESGAGGTALSGQMPLLVNTGYSASDPNGLFETAANALLNLELSAAVNVHGHIAGMIIDD